MNSAPEDGWTPALHSTDTKWHRKAMNIYQQPHPKKNKQPFPLDEAPGLDLMSDQSVDGDDDTHE